MTVRYDDCRISTEEAERVVRVFGMCAGWLCYIGIWQKGLREGFEWLRGDIF